MKVGIHNWIFLDYNIVKNRKYPLIIHNNTDCNINAAVDAIDVLNYNYWDTLHGNSYKKISRYTDNTADRISISIDRLKKLLDIEYYTNHPFQPTIKYIKFRL